MIKITFRSGFRYTSHTLALVLSSALGCSSNPSFSDVPGLGEGAAGGSPNAPGVGDYGFLGSGDQSDAGAGVGGTGDASAADPYTLPPSVTLGQAGEVLCGSELCACNNGIDDDGDGTADGFDAECTGALDDDEGTFSTGIPGDNSDPKWQDCFFDGNSGAGDDQCRYHTDCLTGEKPASDKDCAVSSTCHDFCQARTPNGCDCFGCCTVQLEDASTVDVFIGATCSLENVNDSQLCPRCTPSAACVNTCGECELCPGKSVDDLPASCSSSPPGGGTGGGAGAGGGSSDPQTPAYTCGDGQTVCTDTSQCAAGQYCSLGCCLTFIIR
jgi:hypothetical protein